MLKVDSIKTKSIHLTMLSPNIHFMSCKEHYEKVGGFVTWLATGFSNCTIHSHFQVFIQRTNAIKWVSSNATCYMWKHTILIENALSFK